MERMGSARERGQGDGTARREMCCGRDGTGRERRETGRDRVHRNDAVLDSCPCGADELLPPLCRLPMSCARRTIARRCGGTPTMPGACLPSRENRCRISSNPSSSTRHWNPVEECKLTLQPPQLRQGLAPVPRLRSPGRSHPQVVRISQLFRCSES